MPIKIPYGLPAGRVMEQENIFVMSDLRATHQDIRPLRIAVLNLMPTKITTETQLVRLLSNSSLQIDLTLLRISSHTPKNTSPEHMNTFYKNFDEVKDKKFDGLIITGAPVENYEFDEVNYWSELCEIMEWSKTNVFSTLHICWAAQAGLFYHYGVPKIPLEKKMFGVFNHRVLQPNHPIVRGFDEVFAAPHSRHTGIRLEDIQACPDIELLAVSGEAGAYLISAKDRRMLFVTGHSEYDAYTLSNEYFRDLDAGKNPHIPVNYFPNDDHTKTPPFTWRSNAHLLVSNWLNYYVYQQTPFDLNQLEHV